MKYGILSLSVFLLSACNLAASLTGGTTTHTYTPNYEYRGEVHTMRVIFEVNDNVVTGLTIEPGAISPLEQAHQTALAANVRPLILEQKIDEIDIPETSGEEERLRKVFRGVIEELQKEK